MANAVKEAETKKTTASAAGTAASDTSDSKDALTDLFDRRISVPLTADNARFSRSEGNLISLTLTHPDGETEFFERIVPIRSFPISSPDEFISIREPDTHLKGPGAEIGMIEKMELFPTDQRDLLNEELERRYFTPCIKKIHSMSEKFGYRYLDVTTGAGRIEFIMNTSTSSIRTLEDGRVFLYDIDGNCFTIEDPKRLDKASYKKIEIYL